jgi:hypothetical protein
LKDERTDTRENEPNEGLTVTGESVPPGRESTNLREVNAWSSHQSESFEQLESDAENRRKAQQIRAYVADVRQQAMLQNGKLSTEEEQWINSSLRHADSIDPLCRKVLPDFTASVLGNTCSTDTDEDYGGKQ